MLYVDKPDERPAAIWGVDAATGVAAPYSTEVGLLQHGDRYVTAPVLPSLAGATVHDRETGQSWDLSGVGALPFISPDGTRIAFDGRTRVTPAYANRRAAAITVADLNGTNVRQLTTLFGGGIVGWFPDGSRVLVLGTEVQGGQRPALWHVNVTTGSVEKLDDAARMANISIAPGGAWVAFLTLFEEDAYWNTTWAMNVDTGEQRRLDFAGPYAWVRDQDATLVYVSLRESADQGFGVWRLDVNTGQRDRLVDPARTPLFIANGDWALAPDGKRLAFVSAQDGAIWLVEFTP